MIKLTERIIFPDKCPFCLNKIRKIKRERKTGTLYFCCNDDEHVDSINFYDYCDRNFENKVLIILYDPNVEIEIFTNRDKSKFSPFAILTIFGNEGSIKESIYIKNEFSIDLSSSKKIKQKIKLLLTYS